MTDDMGYSDLGCYGGEIETPNLIPWRRTGQFENTLILFVNDNGAGAEVPKNGGSASYIIGKAK